MSTIVIQHIQSLWTKDSRGGAGARIRNAVPLAVVLPDVAFDSPYFLHHARFEESNGFAMTDRFKSSCDFPELDLRDVEIVTCENGLMVRFIRDGYNVARSRAQPQCADLFTLVESKWGRLTYNGRYVNIDTGNWWYEKSIYNIGWLTSTDCNVFLATEPTSDYSEMVQLW